MSVLSERLYALRKERGLMQEELAEALGVSRQAISKWEMGTGVPTLENLIAISDYFNVSLDSLVKEEQQDSPQISEPEPEPEPSYIAPQPETVYYSPPQYTVKRRSNHAADIAAGIILISLVYLLTSLLSNASVSIISYLASRFFSYDTSTAFLIHLVIQLASDIVGMILVLPLYIMMSVLWRGTASKPKSVVIPVLYAVRILATVIKYILATAIKYIMTLLHSETMYVIYIYQSYQLSRQQFLLSCTS